MWITTYSRQQTHACNDKQVHVVPNLASWNPRACLLSPPLLLSLSLPPPFTISVRLFLPGRLPAPMSSTLAPPPQRRANQRPGLWALANQHKLPRHWQAALEAVRQLLFFKETDRQSHSAHIYMTPLFWRNTAVILRSLFCCHLDTFDCHLQL